MDQTSVQPERPQRWLAAGGVLGALASSSCCIVPVVLFSLGASGAWLGNLSALSPYQPIFVAITLGFLCGRGRTSSNATSTRARAPRTYPDLTHINGHWFQ